jgi:hypothetical protein
MEGFGALQRFKLQVAVDRRQSKREGSSGPASEVRRVEVTPELEQAALPALAACGPPAPLTLDGITDEHRTTVHLKRARLDRG